MLSIALSESDQITLNVQPSPPSLGPPSPFALLPHPLHGGGPRACAPAASYNRHFSVEPAVSEHSQDSLVVGKLPKPPLDEILNCSGHLRSLRMIAASRNCHLNNEVILCMQFPFSSAEVHHSRFSRELLRLKSTTGRERNSRHFVSSGSVISRTKIRSKK